MAKLKEKPEDIFRSLGGQLRMSEAIKHGMTRYMLYSLKSKGIIEQVSRGVFRLVELPPMSNPDWIAVSARFPKAVICLVSALVYHEITTQIPQHISIAVPRGSRLPLLDYPPLLAYRFSKSTYDAGIEMHQMDGVLVKVYSPEKTLADCFKFRNKIGMDVVLEALKLYRTYKKYNLEALLHYAKICRVEKIMRPYLEANI